MERRRPQSVAFGIVVRMARMASMGCVPEEKLDGRATGVVTSLPTTVQKDDHTDWARCNTAERQPVGQILQGMLRFRYGMKVPLSIIRYARCFPACRRAGATRVVHLRIDHRPRSKQQFGLSVVTTRCLAQVQSAFGLHFVAKRQNVVPGGVCVYVCSVVSSRVV